MPDTITISKDEYFFLKKRDVELALLEEAGVDNWSGCDEAFENFGEVLKELEIEIFGKERE